MRLRQFLAPNLTLMCNISNISNTLYKALFVNGPHYDFTSTFSFSGHKFIGKK